MGIRRTMLHIEQTLKAEGIDYEIAEENMGLEGNLSNWTKTHVIEGSSFKIHPEFNLIEIYPFLEKSTEKNHLLLHEKLKQISKILGLDEGRPSTGYNFNSLMGPIANFSTWDQFVRFDKQLEEEGRRRDKNNPASILWGNFCKKHPSIPKIPEGVHPQGFILSSLFFWVNNTQQTELDSAAIKDFMENTLSAEDEGKILTASKGISRKDVDLLEHYGIPEEVVVDFLKKNR
jgi:hypothetical protein